MRQCFTVRQVIDQDDIDIRVFAEDDPERLPADAAESIDREVHANTLRKGARERKARSDSLYYRWLVFDDT